MGGGGCPVYSEESSTEHFPEPSAPARIASVGVHAAGGFLAGMFRVGVGKTRRDRDLIQDMCTTLPGFTQSGVAQTFLHQATLEIF